MADQITKEDVVKFIENMSVLELSTLVKELEEKFASYWISYPGFKIYFNNNELEFASLIKNSEEVEIKVDKDGLIYKFIIISIYQNETALTTFIFLRLVSQSLTPIILADK